MKVLAEHQTPTPSSLPLSLRGDSLHRSQDTGAQERRAIRQVLSADAAAQVAPLAPTAVQTEGPISKSSDACEQDATRWTARMQHRWSRSSQSEDAPCRDSILQPLRTPSTPNFIRFPSSVHVALQSNGRPLHDSTRSVMEPHLLHDLRSVRVHTDAAASRSANDVHSRAYTVGQHIVFAEGEYNPASASGRDLLAHELCHVVQQQGVGGDVLMRQEKAASSDATDPLVDGLKKTLEHVPGSVTDKLTALLKDRLKQLWNQLEAVDQGVAIAQGAAMTGLTLGFSLADTLGRKQLGKLLGGKNLAKLFQFDPVENLMPISIFAIDETSGDKRNEGLYTFEVGLSGKPFIERLRSRYPTLPEMEFELSLKIGIGKQTSDSKLLSGGLNFTIWKGLGLNLSVGKDLGPSEDARSISAFIPKIPQSGAQFMINLDLLKFGLFPSSLQRIFQ